MRPPLPSLPLLAVPLRAVALCAARAGLALPAAAKTWPGGDGMALMFAALGRDDAGGWMLPETDLRADLSSLAGVSRIDGPHGIACTGTDAVAAKATATATAATGSQRAGFGMVLAADASRCGVSWRVNTGPMGYAEAEITRLFPGPKASRADDVTLVWDTLPGPDADRTERLATDAAEILSLCSRMTADMAARGKPFP